MLLRTLDNKMKSIVTFTSCFTPSKGQVTTMSLPTALTPLALTPTGTSLPSTHGMAILEEGTLVPLGNDDCSLGDIVYAERKKTLTGTQSKVVCASMRVGQAGLAVLTHLVGIPKMPTEEEELSNWCLPIAGSSRHLCCSRMEQRQVSLGRLWGGAE